MAAEPSPLAPTALPQLPPLAGVRLAARPCGIRYQGRRDVCLLEFTPGTTVAGVLTRSTTASAPVEWCREALSGGRARALIANSGNANAFTGAAGKQSVSRVVEAAARAFNCAPSEVFVASTGVIGEPWPDDRITRALDELQTDLSEDSWRLAAEAIMTTDTFPKVVTRTTNIGRRAVTINGIAKGSGMIAPNMATMLAFLCTDAAVSAPVLRTLLVRAVNRSFHAITVDSDTSTSDTVLLCATGRGERLPGSSFKRPPLSRFASTLDDAMIDLAQQVVRDGEGAQKFVTITVLGAASQHAARVIALSIANSPLVKTAIAGEDANWGRVVMAVGKSGERADKERLSIKIGGNVVARDGAVVSGYDEAPVAKHMKGRQILIEVDVAVGRGRATVWTCDLTHGYIDINAAYRS